MSENGNGASASLRIENLSVDRGGRPIVVDVSIEIPPAQVTALLGANGAGKSTLVLAVAGLLRTSGGRVLLGDLDLTGLRPEQVRAAGVAVVPEGRRLLPALTRRGQPPRRDVLAQRRACQGGHRLRARALPGAREALDTDRTPALGR